MTPDFWHRQTAEKPLFPHLAWSRPENRNQAGKLLIVGGNLYGFAAPAAAYNESLLAGIGTSRVLLPDAIQKVVGSFIANGEFSASTPSGSFSQRALVDLLRWAQWADGTLFAGNLGRNSETAILLEKFLQKSTIPTTLTKDAVDYVVSAPRTGLERPHTTLVLSLSQLQRLAVAAKFARSIAFSMDLLRVVDWLHAFTERYAPYIVVKHLDTILVAVNGQVSTTKLDKDIPIWRVTIASHGAVWWLQNPSKPFEAITEAVYDTITRQYRPSPGQSPSAPHA